MIVTKARTVGRGARGVVCRPALFGAFAAKATRTALSLAMAIMLALPLAGCRVSDVLTEKIVGAAGQYNIDYSLSPVAVENPLASSDISQNEDDSDRLDDHDYSESSYDEDQQNADDQVSGSQGQNASDGAGSGTAYDGTGEQKNGSTIKFDFTGNADVNDPDPNDPSNPDNSQISTSPTDWTPTEGDNKASTIPTSPIITKGNYGNLPKTVTAMAAAGANATVVQSIGGTGALAAVNQKWLDDLPAAAYDNQSELEGVRGIASWGEGATMSAATFQEVTSLLPHDWTAAVLVSNSYPITQEQAEAFSADSDTGRIYVIEVGSMGVADTLDADIADAVQMVGELLNASGGGDGKAQERASTWKSLHTQALETTMQKNGGYSTWLLDGVSENWLYQGLNQSSSAQQVTQVSSNRYYASYIDAWATAKQEVVRSENNYGILFKRSDGDDVISAWPFNDWMEGSYGYATLLEDLKTDISDGVGVYVAKSQGTASAYALMDYYYQHAGVVDMSMTRQFSASDNSVMNYAAALQLFNIAQYPYGYTSVVSAWELWGLRQPNISSSRDSLVAVGDDDYPAIIVRNKAIAEKVVSSAGKADESSLTVGQYNFGKNYSVFVMPYGIAGSWADGTFESFLMAPWTYCMYQQRSGDTIDLSYSDGFVNQFYSTFYRCGSAGILDGDGGTDSTGGAACGGYGYSVQAICKTE